MRKPRWLVWVEFAPVAALLPLLSLIPHRAMMLLGRWLGVATWFLLGNYRRIVRTNLRIAFGETLSEEEIRAHSKAAFVNAVQTFLEFALLFRLRQPQMARLTLEPKGYDEYKQAVARGQGVIAVSAHIGNWYWPVMCAAVEGFKVNVIVRPLDNPLLDRLMNKVFDRWGIRVIPRRQATVMALSALRRGETVALMVDQNAALHGLFIPFFGAPAATTRGMHMLRRGSGAEVVAVHSRREGQHHLVSMSWLRDLPEDEYGSLSAVSRYFEAVISRHKGDYFWLHPRWKKRPPGEPSLYPGLRT